MFPNDDICNVEVAKKAAHRLFRKYRNLGGNKEGSLGKSEVNRLMKATYEAINMPYDPNEQDISSFISIFDQNGVGMIELDNFEAMAVKYLCGVDLQSNTKNPEQKIIKQQGANQKLKEEMALVETKVKPQLRICDRQQYQQRKIYSPRSNLTSTTFSSTSYYSPKNQISFKESASTKDSFISMKMIENERIPQSEVQLDNIVKQGNMIFNKHRNPEFQGLTDRQAGNAISQTYDLFNKKNFRLSEEDVRIWIKLCDRNNDGIVEWEDYKLFLLRTYERERKDHRTH